MRLAGIDAAGHFFGCQAQAVAVIFRLLAGGALALAHLFEPFRCAETAEAVAVVLDLANVVEIDVLAVALAVGAIGAADVRAFRPFEPAPFQRIQNLLLKLRRRACGVGILDTKDEGAAVLLCEEIVEQCDIGGADMRLAGGEGAMRTRTAESAMVFARLTCFSPLAGRQVRPPGAHFMGRKGP